MIGKFFCNIGGYTTFKIGATKFFGRWNLLGVSHDYYRSQQCAHFTTIQAQDFPDIEGDVASGRMTLPLYAPEFSQALTVLAHVITYAETLRATESHIAYCRAF